MILDTKPTLDTFTCFWIRFSVFGYVLIDFRCYFWIRSFFGYVWIRLKVFGYLWIRLDTFGYVWIRLDMATQLILDTFGRGYPPQATQQQQTKWSQGGLTIEPMQQQDRGGNPIPVHFGFLW